MIIAVYYVKELETPVFIASNPHTHTHTIFIIIININKDLNAQLSVMENVVILLF